MSTQKASLQNMSAINLLTNLRADLASAQTAYYEVINHITLQDLAKPQPNLHKARKRLQDIATDITNIKCLMGDGAITADSDIFSAINHAILKAECAASRASRAGDYELACNYYARANKLKHTIPDEDHVQPWRTILLWGDVWLAVNAGDLDKAAHLAQSVLDDLRFVFGYYDLYKNIRTKLQEVIEVAADATLEIKP